MREKAKNVMELGPGPPEAASLGALEKDRRLKCSLGHPAHCIFSLPWAPFLSCLRALIS